MSKKDIFVKNEPIMIKRGNDNEHYVQYRNKKLFWTEVYTSEEENRYYDKSFNGMPLYNLQTEDGEELPYSIYQFELEYYKKAI